MKFSELVSVGDNCEIGIQLVRLGYSKSTFFRYVSCQLDNVIKFVENKGSGLFDKNNIKPVTKNMVKCLNYGFGFHTNFEIERLDDGSLFISHGQENQYEIEKNKLNYLSEKFFSTLMGEQTVLFIYRSRYSKFESIYNFIDVIEQNYPQLEFKVLVVKSVEQDFEANHPKVLIENLSHLGYPGADIEGFDEEGWDRIAEKYFEI